MKKLCFSMTIYFITFASFGQNVGIGELSPGAKLTIRGSDAFNRNFLVKTMSGDTSFYIYDNFLFINGYPTAGFVSASLTVNNKYFVPLEGAQLAIAASGERSGGSSNGSLSQIQFYNTNNMAARFFIDSYLGTQAPNYWRLNYIYPEPPFNARSYFHIGQDGSAGFSTTSPIAKLQINHRSSTTVPTLRLHDSSTTAGPIVHFSNTGGTDDWQIRSTLNNFSDRLDFFYNNAIMTSMVNGGGSTASLGIGTTNPVDRLHINTGALHCYTRYTNSATGASSTDGVIAGVSGAGTAFFHNYEAAPMYLGTAGINRMMIDASGRVGIGVDPPSEALDVNGNIESSGLLRVTGEVNRPATGSSHLLPIAYGNISATGTISHSSGNITVTKTGVGDYEIEIAGVNYNFSLFATLVTPAGSAPVFASTNSLGGHLLVHTLNLAGNPVDNRFSFVVYAQ